ncbi:hypothetical protein AAFF_G00174260 [Aldrovandia affinis]|uniref:Gypsy retrotransposon integrase-like protein 1 n=1 Tax=Aldrovandia affinis TaxID=143900 RepID=A0AAD7RLF3_9TELE|nr:hypothetical protein AAFF_G00174260 [Aldrovandia affinis]
MQARAMAPNSSTEEQLVHAVSNTGRFAKYAKPQLNSARVALQEEWRTRACRNCGRLHKPRQCPAYNMDCRKCGKKNHFAAVCRSNPDVALVEAEAPDVNALYIAGISRAHKGNSRDTGWSSSLRVGGTLVTFKLDTGAEANLLPLAVAEELPMPLNMQRTGTVLVAYGGARIQPKGVVKLLVQARRKQAQLYLFVTDASDTPLLGRQACVQLDLVRRVEALARSAPATKQDLLQQYSSVFEGLGEFPGEHHIYTDPKTPPLGGSITQLVQAASETDEEMLLLKDLHTGRWPDRRKSVPPRAQPYWPVRHSLYIDDGLVMVNKRIVVPKSLRAEVLQRLHTAHQGIQRSLAHARAIMYWPGLSNDVRAMVDSCSSCQEQLPSNQREPLLPHPVPDAPWQRIAADIFELHGRPFLLITDYYSKFPEVLQLPDKTAGSVIARFKAVFSRHGVPFTLISDHWRQKESYDKTAAPLLPFRTGERVRMKTAQGWQPASIVRAREEPRSYDIITPSGATYRRNRKHLRRDRAARHDDQQDDIDAPDSDTEQGATPVEAPEPGANAPESQSAPCTRSGRRIKPPVRLKDYDTASD